MDDYDIAFEVLVGIGAFILIVALALQIKAIMDMVRVHRAEVKETTTTVTTRTVSSSGGVGEKEVQTTTTTNGGGVAAGGGDICKHNRVVPPGVSQAFSIAYVVGQFFYVAAGIVALAGPESSDLYTFLVSNIILTIEGGIMLWLLGQARTKVLI